MQVLEYKIKLNNQIIADTAEYVSEYLKKNLSNDFCYHDFFHTFSVVNAADLLCDANGLNKAEKRIVITAAWFHDTGYTKQVDGHEQQGASIAEDFLKNKNICDDEISQVKACILATSYPQQPKNMLEKIICDADMLHVGEPKFNERSKLLRKEWELTKGKVFSDKEWCELNINFLNNHSFHTNYCREQLDKSKSKNLKKLLKKQKALNDLLPVNGKEKKINGIEIDEGKKEKKVRLERGVETLFRMTSGNHMMMSGMADDKAHILLSINSIIISVTISLLAKYLDKMPYLILPTVLLLCVCLVTIVFAVLTTKPKVSKGIFTAEQIQNRQANLLFFGNFHNMGWESYEWGIQEIMYDKEYLYKSMTKDIYFLGKVLAKKYKYLDIGYKVFMYGLIGSVLAFGISFFFAH